MASNAENVSIWWRHHADNLITPVPVTTKQSVDFDTVFPRKFHKHRQANAHSSHYDNVVWASRSPNRRRLVSLFNRLFKLTKKKTHKLRIAGTMWSKSTRDSETVSFPRHGSRTSSWRPHTPSTQCILLWAILRLLNALQRFCPT